MMLLTCNIRCRVIINIGFVRTPEIQQMFYLIPTILYIRNQANNHNFLIYFGDLFFEVVFLSRGSQERMKEQMEQILNQGKELTP